MKKKKENQLVVTRHPALLEYLLEKKIVSENTETISHATPENVEGKDIVGVLPLHLAAYAKTVTEIPLMIPAELRGKELTLDQMNEFAGKTATYKVEKLS